MYKLTHPNTTNVLYLIGSIHNKEYEDLLDEIKIIINKCDLLLCECDMDQIMILKSGETEIIPLQQRISTDLYKVLNKYLSLGVLDELKFEPLYGVMINIFFVILAKYIYPKTSGNSYLESDICSRFKNYKSLENYKIHCSRGFDMFSWMLSEHDKVRLSDNNLKAKDAQNFIDTIKELINNSIETLNETEIDKLRCAMKNVCENDFFTLNDDIMSDNIHTNNMETSGDILILIGLLHIDGVIENLTRENYIIEKLHEKCYR